MKWFTNLKIRTKLISSFAVVIALVAFLSVFAIIQLTGHDTEYTYLIARPIQSRIELSEFQRAFRDVRINAAMITIHAGNEDREAGAASVESAYNTAVAGLEEARQIIDNYRTIVNESTHVNQEQKNFRLEQVDLIEEDMSNYRTLMLDPQRQLALAGDFKGCLDLSASAGQYAAEIKSVIDELMAAAVTNVNNM
ncbi:MAG: hypothetical protein LBS19_12115, partial [Clostridiales bacterium]|nr:hypothetical protein [Clostridiales bacterium]